jgi:hypothetical protein
MFVPRTAGRLASFASLSALVVSSAALSLPSYAASGDRDHDGMPNRWEAHHGLNPDRADGDRDRDRDGLRNLAEYRRHSDPRNEDTDHDGDDDGDEVGDDSRKTRLLVRDTDDDGTPDGDEDIDDDGIDNEDEDDSAESCRRDDDDRDHDHVADEDENELGGSRRDSDSDDDGVLDGDEDSDHDGEAAEDEDDSLDDRCDHADEDTDDLLGSIVSFDSGTGYLVVEKVDAGEQLTFVVTEDTEIEFDSSGKGSHGDADEANLVEGQAVAEVDIDDDVPAPDGTAGVLEEIELAR